jgi:hypothetical protein
MVEPKKTGAFPIEISQERAKLLGHGGIQTVKSFMTDIRILLN